VNFPAEHVITVDREVEAAPKVGPSKYLGVSWKKSKRRWITQIWGNGRPIYLGAFKSEEEAALKYDEYAPSFGRYIQIVKVHGSYTSPGCRALGSLKALLL